MAGPQRDTAAPRPTSRDVARAAGVSQATVSLVLGDKWQGRVAERTAERVRAAARELGYRPNLAARNLRLGRTRTALLVVPALTNEFFARVHTGAARVAARHGFGVVLYPTPDLTAPARDPFDSARASLDGVLASSMASEALGAIRGDELPLVMLDSDPAGSLGASTVNLDIADGMRQATEHLLALGHRDRLHLVDLQYADVRPEKGLYNRLAARGKMKRLLDEGDVERARTKPPEDTRAYFRGRCLEQYADDVAAASWDSVIFDLPGRDSLQRVPTLEPLRGTRNHVKELLDRCRTAEDLVRVLSGG